MNLWGLSHNLFDYSHTEMNYEVCLKNLAAVEKRFSSTVRADVHTEFRLAFAGLPQVPRRCSWRLRDSRKSHGDAVGVCGTPASLTEMQLAFAGLPQVPRRCSWRLRNSRKSHGDAVGVCGTPASLTEMQLAFAELPQVSRRCSWRLRDSRKSHGDTVDVCGTPASPTEMRLVFAGTLQALICFLFSFLMRCRHPSVCAPLLGGIFFVVFCEVTGVLFGRYRTRYIFAPVS